MSFHVYVKYDDDGKVIDTIKLGNIFVLNKTATFVGDNQQSYDGKIYDSLYYIEQGDPPKRQYIPPEVYNQLTEDLREERWKIKWMPGQYGIDRFDELPK